MVAFLRWAQSIVVGTLNGILKFALAVVLLILVLFGIGLTVGDGLPSKIVLALDLRSPVADSAEPDPFEAAARPPTIMDIVLALDAAGRDSRVKGVFLRLGTADLSVPQAEEIGAAIQRFRQTGKFVIAHSQGFMSNGLGDYLTAASADEIWMQPKSPFGTSGAGAGAIFLRGLFDKFDAVPQMVKRSDFKSAADMYMEKDYTAPDRLQTTALLQSWYDNATTAAAADRKLNPKAVVTAFEMSPQFAGDAKREGLIDRMGYDDEAEAAARDRAGSGASLVSLKKYWHDVQAVSSITGGTHVALIEAAGEIVDGTTGGGSLFGGNNNIIAGDDLSDAIRAATKDKSIKAILLRVDSPGGSVTASDQILDAEKKAEAAGKPVIVSMGAVAASGGYYISASAAKIVAEPGTLTGSIGVLTGKVSLGKTIGLVGANADEIGVGKNALFDSGISPFTPDQLANLNAQADATYADFTQKVADGRKLPLSKVQDIAKGRVWTGADAKPLGLVDELGGFWTAVAALKQVAGIPADERVQFVRFPKTKSLAQAVEDAFGGTTASMRAIQGLADMAQTPGVRSVVEAVGEAPHGNIEMRATNLPAQ
ncbi:MAG: signal peptide peptidase SppA [Rhizomicrobium sp.]